MIKIEYAYDQMLYRVYNYEKLGNGDMVWKDAMLMQTLTKPIDSRKVEPMFVIEDIQELLEAILSIGIKPGSESKLEGILKAQEKHLEDMRALVFKTKSQSNPSKNESGEK